MKMHLSQIAVEQLVDFVTDRAFELAGQLFHSGQATFGDADMQR